MTDISVQELERMLSEALASPIPVSSASSLATDRLVQYMNTRGVSNSIITADTIAVDRTAPSASAGLVSVTRNSTACPFTPLPPLGPISPIFHHHEKPGAFVGYTTDELPDSHYHRSGGRSLAQLLSEELERSRSAEPSLWANSPAVVARTLGAGTPLLRQALPVASLPASDVHQTATTATVARPDKGWSSRCASPAALDGRLIVGEDDIQDRPTWAARTVRQSSRHFRSLSSPTSMIDASIATENGVELTDTVRLRSATDVPAQPRTSSRKRAAAFVAGNNSDAASRVISLYAADSGSTESIYNATERASPKLHARVPIRRKRHYLSRDQLKQERAGAEKQDVCRTAVALGVEANSATSHPRSTPELPALIRLDARSANSEPTPAPPTMNTANVLSAINVIGNNSAELYVYASENFPTVPTVGAAIHPVSSSSSSSSIHAALRETGTPIALVATSCVEPSSSTETMIRGRRVPRPRLLSVSSDDRNDSPLTSAEPLSPIAAAAAAAEFEEMVRPGHSPHVTPAQHVKGLIQSNVIAPSPGLFNSFEATSQEPVIPYTPLPASSYRRKASKFFGVDESDLAKATASANLNTPWFLKNDYTPMDLMYNMEGTVSSGTLRALVDQLTPHNSRADSLFERTFLTCFRQFCQPSEFVHLLFLRYALKPPTTLTPDECKTWLDKKLVPIRIRVFKIIKLWLESYWVHETDNDCLRDLQRFASGPVMHMSPQLAKRLLASVKENLKPRVRRPSRTSSKLHRLIPQTPSNTTMPMLWMDDGDPFISQLAPAQQFATFDIEPNDLAVQLALMTWDLFVAIKASELIGQAFSKKDTSIAANVKAMVAFSSKLTIWVTESVIFEEDAKRRAELLRYFIKVADVCFKYGNLDAVHAIITALDSSVLERLTKTWKLVSKRHLATLGNLREVFDHRRNCQAYRQTLRTITPPCIPFLGMYLRDLTYLDDIQSPIMPSRPLGDDPATANTVSSTGSQEPRVPFHKYLQSMRLIMDIERFQSCPYSMTSAPKLQTFLLQLLKTSRTDGDPEKLYAASLLREPRAANAMNEATPIEIRMPAPDVAPPTAPSFTATAAAASPPESDEKAVAPDQPLTSLYDPSNATFTALPSRNIQSADITKKHLLSQPSLRR